MQTVCTLIFCGVWFGSTLFANVYTVCQCPFYGDTRHKWLNVLLFVVMVAIIDAGFQYFFANEVSCRKGYSCAVCLQLAKQLIRRHLNELKPIKMVE